MCCAASAGGLRLLLLLRPGTSGRVENAFFWKAFGHHVSKDWRVTWGQ